ncbi:MAG: hypothetical protein Q9223_005990 [Gallowayella weberi]
MHYIFPLLASLLWTTSAIPLKPQGFEFDYVSAPGPIPFSDGDSGGGWPKGTTVRSKDGGATDQATKDTLTQCLIDYSAGRFYDSWNGNECGGVGWFKGTVENPNDQINTYDCYQACAPYVQAWGVNEAQKEFLCEYRTGASKKCWMGFHPLTPEELATQANTAAEISTA